MPVELGLSQQLLLAVVDKIGLGAVVGFGALLGNRLLERYKASQAIRAAVAQKRIDQLAPLWDAVVRLEIELGEIRSAASSMANEIYAAARPSEYPSNQDWLNAARAEIRTACEPILAPRLERARTELGLLEKRANELFFWTGEDLNKQHKQHFRILGDSIQALLESIRGLGYSKGPPVAVSFSLPESRLDVTKLRRWL